MSLQTWLDEASRTDSILNGVVPSLRRRRFIENYQFPEALRNRFAREYSHLSSEQCELVWKALRQYFVVCALAGRQMTAMPSHIVDNAWHTFILFTRDYELFCRQAFSHYLHHTPAEAMKSLTNGRVQNGAAPSQSPLRLGLKLTWRLACRVENIDPILPQSLPLLFAVDAMLDVPNATRYDARQMALFARTGSAMAAPNTSSCGGSSGSCGGCSGVSAGSCADGGDGSDGGCGDGGGGDSGCGGGCGGGD